jgi:hypothetical protein
MIKTTQRYSSQKCRIQKEVWEHNCSDMTETWRHYHTGLRKLASVEVDSEELKPELNIFSIQIYFCLRKCQSAYPTFFRTQYI